ncbi:MAG TPA: zf-HC2 domain-containing protein [Pyrinomonadaceae bacterium]|jgi:hypothetical protein
MNCEETEKLFSPYLDGDLPGGASLAAETHLGQCPACRARLDEMRSIVRGLALLERPALPPGFNAAINDALLIERAARPSRPALSPVALVLRWLEPRVMPYTVGALASLILFVTVLSAIRPQIAAFRDLAASAARSAQDITIEDGEPGGYDVRKPLTPENFAATRLAYAAESPSINPNGALARLAWSPPSGSPGDDDMIVVADVYGNGRASLAAVVEPPRNPHALDDLEDALRKNAAFVPASLDRRPQTMRVVFVLQKMNVQEGRSY